ncbi:hypothetical protein DXB06_05260 [Butyricicoccus sp. OF13-6]|nr:hypothetical protein DXB06_05260 [Butyricicoccus sp. OF13-6]
MKKYKFGVLGAGNMGTAIAEGAVRAGRFAPEQVLMFNRSEEKRAAHAAKATPSRVTIPRSTQKARSCCWPSSRRISMKSCRIWRNMKGRSRLSYPLPQA